MKAFRDICGVILAVVVVAGAACAVRHEEAPLAPAQQVELNTLTAQIADASRTPRTRREAASLLLARPYPQAAESLRGFLVDASNPTAQLAVARAVAQSPPGRREFVEPLVAMLLGAEPPGRAAAAEALSAEKDSGGLDELVRLLSRRKTSRPVRLAIISAMSGVLESKAVSALVAVLDDPDKGIRDAACEALGSLTGIRTFDHDLRKWKSWWARNEDRPGDEWLAGLAGTISVVKGNLEKENAELRRRLAEAMNNLYAATSPASREALLLEMLKDPLAEVRLVAVTLAGQRLGSGRTLAEPLLAQVRVRLSDSDPAVRRVAAVLLATSADKQAPAMLTARLKREQSDQVRQAIYQGLGLLRDASAWDMLLTGIAEPDRHVAAAAAGALGRIAEKNDLGQDRRDAAVKALVRRYEDSAGSDSSGLREALLGAMGVLKDSRLADVMTSALKDPAAAVRLSGIKGLQALNLPRSVSAVVPLVRDADRGVRLAAIAAVGLLGGADNLDTILARTDARAEPDAAVRRQAWTVVMELLAKADTPTLRSLSGRLAKRADAGEHLIEVLKLWAARIPQQQADEWISVRLTLARALIGAGRPAEGAGELSAVHAAMVKAGKSQAADVWLEWVGAMLAAGDASVIAAIADTADPKYFSAAVEMLLRRLRALDSGKDPDSTVRLAGTAVERLDGRLGPEQRNELVEILKRAKARQRLADRQRVSALIASLTGADDGARQAAARELEAMKERAVVPLIDQLRETITSEKPDPVTEGAILEVLSTLAPRLDGYDPAAPAADRLRILASWAERSGS